MFGFKKSIYLDRDQKRCARIQCALFICSTAKKDPLETSHRPSFPSSVDAAQIKVTNWYIYRITFFSDISAFLWKITALVSAVLSWSIEKERTIGGTLAWLATCIKG